MPSILPISKSLRRSLVGLLLAVFPLFALAEYLDLPPPGDDLVGRMRYVKARADDTLVDIAHDHSVGQDEIVMANPKMSRWLPGDGTKVLIPDRYILPDAPHVGIVANIPEMRLYFFPPGEGKNPPTQVITYPISVGRMDWKSPMGITKIVEKIKDPTWTPPESIKKEHAAEGEILPDVVPAGPDNPLGQFAMRLGVKGSYLIHGTGLDKADGIGMMVTHGCMRMYPEDVAQLFPKVSVGTQVNLVYQSVKVGWRGNVLYIEVSQPLDEDHLGYEKLYALAMPLIQKKTADHPDFVLNEEALRKALQSPNGIPTAISGGAVGAELAASPERIPTMPRVRPVESAAASTPSASPAPTTAPAPVPPKPAPVPEVVKPAAAPPAVNRLGSPALAPAQPTAVPLHLPQSIAPPRPAQPVPPIQPVQVQQRPPIQPSLTQPTPQPAPPIRRVEAPPAPQVPPADSRREEQLLPPIY